MHELAIAEDILEIVRIEAEKNAVVKIVKVELEIGKLSGVDIEALQFALETIEKRTLFINTIFCIEGINGLGMCKMCQSEFEMQELLSVCPTCKSQPSSILKGKEMKVLSIIAE
jgi:hydrogenase nickel incorporation protein HypA/HybF